MIKSIGIDSVEIERFLKWNSYNKSSLLKIFQPIELEYCLKVPIKSPERFAIRFAAKEAFYKAFTQLGPCSSPLTLLTVCKNVSIIHSDEKIPKLNVSWQTLWPYLAIKPYILKTHVSLTHSKAIATAVIILEK